MIIRLLDQLGFAPAHALATLAAFILALLVALVFHVIQPRPGGHRIGGPNSPAAGQTTLNPLAHLDPAGHSDDPDAGFGWAKPVTVNPALLRTGERSGMAVVALAGPLSNVVIAAVLALPIKMGAIPLGLRRVHHVLRRSSTSCQATSWARWSSGTS